MLAATIANYAFTGPAQQTGSPLEHTLSFVYLCVLAFGLSGYWVWRTIKGIRQRRRNKHTI